MVNDILHTQPMNTLVSGSGTGADTNLRNYGMAVAAMSQSPKDLGITSSKDASDGIMDGKKGGTSITMGGMGGNGMMGSGTMMQSTVGTSGLANAMKEFLGSAMN